MLRKELRDSLILGRNIEDRGLEFGDAIGVTNSKTTSVTRVSLSKILLRVRARIFLSWLSFCIESGLV